MTRRAMDAPCYPSFTSKVLKTRPIFSVNIGDINKYGRSSAHCYFGQVTQLMRIKSSPLSHSGSDRIILGTGLVTRT